MTLSRNEVVGLLDANGLRASRALGQNFVADPNTVRRIARLAGVGPADRVVEVGAGLGCLTIALAETGAAVTAVEVDRRLLPVLGRVLAERAPGVCLVEGDALRLDWGGLLGDGAEWSLVANLPYNIATPLVADLLDGVPALRRMVVMVQREVGERLVARPGDDAYGAVSVKVSYWAEPRLLGRVPASVFVPRPNVESVLVGIDRRNRPAVDPDLAPPSLLFPLVSAGFAQRRKMLRRSLAGRVPPSAWAEAGVDPQSRAEQLDVEAWGRLAAAAGRPERLAGGLGPGAA